MFSKVIKTEKKYYKKYVGEDRFSWTGKHSQKKTDRPIATDLETTRNREGKSG